jgi:hypothetical protein
MDKYKAKKKLFFLPSPTYKLLWLILEVIHVHVGYQNINFTSS